MLSERRAAFRWAGVGVGGVLVSSIGWTMLVWIEAGDVVARTSTARRVSLSRIGADSSGSWMIVV